MVCLRHFKASDHPLISSRFGLSDEAAKEMIRTWNTCVFGCAYFEMFAVQKDQTVIGMISLYEHAGSVISIGPEIFEAYRRHGFAKDAMTQALEIAGRKGYRIVLQQVRTNHTASIRLHESLGFEKDCCIYRNEKGNDVYLFLKTL